MARITWMEPYETVRGKFAKKSNLINKLAGILHEQIAHRQGKRMTSVSDAEQQHRENFGTIAKNVTARLKMTSPTYEQDVMAFMAQRDTAGGYPRMRQWLWHDEQSKLG